MKYFPQSPNACLAYAALSIGAVDMEGVREYEKALRAAGGCPTEKVARNWSLNYIPWYTPVTGRLVKGAGGKYVKDVAESAVKPVGTGIAIAVANDRYGFAICHALGYSLGRYMDPSSGRSSGKSETWEELVERWESEGYNSVKLIDYARAS